jgi:phage nucleotide-binding protein
MQVKFITTGEVDMEIQNRIVSPQKLVQNQGAKILVYGMAGAGKTTLAKTAPGKVLVISAEAGLLSIKDANNVEAIEVKEASEVMELHNALKSGAIQYDTVCLDSVSEISEILLTWEKSRSKDPRMAYGNVQESVTNLMRAFRDLNMHVLFLCKEDVINDDGVLRHAPKMVGTKLGESITYFFDEVLALRIIEDQDEDGKNVQTRWLQTTYGQGYKAKDRSGKLEAFEKPNITALIEKLGFTLTNDNIGEANV